MILNYITLTTQSSYLFNQMMTVNIECAKYLKLCQYIMKMSIFNEATDDPLYCRRCGHTATTRSNLFQHLRRKNICQPLCEDIQPKELLEELLAEKKKHKTIQCTNCDAMFTTRQAKHVHLKTCKKNDVITKDTIHEIVEEKLQVLINSNKPLSVNNGTINNTVNNHYHINIADFKMVDGDHVTSLEIIAMISKISREDRYYAIFQDLLRKIYFNKTQPHKHCLMIPNIRDKLCKIVNNGKVEYAKKLQVIDMAIGTAHNALHNVYEDNEYHHMITMMNRQLMNKLNDKYYADDEIHMEKLRDDTTITILNNKHIVLDTWNLLQ